jgi:hypothetical protein
MKVIEFVNLPNAGDLKKICRCSYCPLLEIHKLQSSAATSVAFDLAKGVAEVEERCSNNLCHWNLYYRCHQFW